MNPEQSAHPAALGYRQVRYHFSEALPRVLSELSGSLLISTYRSGQLVVVSADQQALRFSFHQFGPTTGLALNEHRLAVASPSQVWFLENVPDLASQMKPVGEHDTCLVTRNSFVTGNITTHEVAWAGNELWMVNTRFSCLATLHEDYSFIPRWRPPFISQFSPEDRCHLNGVAIDDGRPKYVTALSETNEPQGWRNSAVDSGCLIEVDSGETIVRGLARPHSPRIFGDRLFVLESGQGNLTCVDAASRTTEVVTKFPGFTRGLSCLGPFAFVGLSKFRPGTSVQTLEEDKCGVGVVDLRTGQPIAALQFLSGIEEVFDVVVLPGSRFPALVGPAPEADDTKPVWVVPSVDQANSLAPHRFDRGVARAESRPAGATRETRASETASDDAVALFNQANQFLRDDRFAEAEQLYRQAIAAQENFVDAHSNLGVALHYQQRLDEARQVLERAVALNPDSVDARMNLANLMLYAGDYQRGWVDYEGRWQCEGFGDKPPNIDSIAPVWDGSPLDDKTILVYPEQGIGDDVMFASCLPDVINAAGRCVVLVRPRLANMFRRSFPQAEIYLTDALAHQIQVDEVGEIDFQIAAGSLPLHFRTAEEEFSDRESFLIADEELVESWRDRFRQQGDAPNIGISWRGGAEPAEVRRRSLALEHWNPILQTPGAQFVNLQYGDCSQDLERIDKQLGVHISHWDDVNALEDIETFVAQIAALDLVISIDNSTVHMAGALGIPTWMMTPLYSASGWRWQRGRDRSLWYPSLQVVRQARFGVWNDVVDRVAKSLAQAIESRSFGKVVSSPDAAEGLAHQGIALHEQQRVQEAIAAFRQAISLRPDRAEYHNHLGNALQDAGEQDAALECYRRAVEVDDTCVAAHQNLGFVLINHGYLDEGLPHLRRAQELQPSDINRVLMATALPVVYESIEHVQRQRQRLKREVNQLVADGVTIDTTRTTVPTNFFCAYQGRNDRDIQSQIGKIHRGVSLACTENRKSPHGGKIKIGFLSDHFCNHTIGRLNLRTVRHLPRDKFEVTVISVGDHDDTMARQFQQFADQYIVVPNQVEIARQMIADMGLDVLFFTDVGMHHVIYTLSFSRMAPVQCATWGHPVTTGSPAIDFFVSAEHLETDDADQHYTEQLLRLPRVGVCYEMPQPPVPGRDRQSFGLSDDTHIYLCPQTLFKIHPEFDDILAAILRADPRGEVVLIEGRVPQWTRLLRERFDRTMPDVASRVRFLPTMSHETFLSLNAVADVALDPIHFGGGNTTYEALAMGLPVVTWPSQLMRGRITYALYQQMQLHDCIVDSPNAYVHLAVQLGVDADFRKSIVTKIEETRHKVFDDTGAIVALGDALYQRALHYARHVD